MDIYCTSSVKIMWCVPEWSSTISLTKCKSLYFLVTFGGLPKWGRFSTFLVVQIFCHIDLAVDSDIFNNQISQFLCTFCLNLQPLVKAQYQFLLTFALCWKYRVINITEDNNDTSNGLVNIHVICVGDKPKLVNTRNVKMWFISMI